VWHLEQQKREQPSAELLSAAVHTATGIGAQSSSPPGCAMISQPAFVVRTFSDPPVVALHFSFPIITPRYIMGLGQRIG
jgi:hypothetical protein